MCLIAVIIIIIIEQKLLKRARTSLESLTGKISTEKKNTIQVWWKMCRHDGICRSLCITYWVIDDSAFVRS